MKESTEKLSLSYFNKRRDLVEVCSKCNVRMFRTGLFKPLKEFPELIKNLKK